MKPQPIKLSYPAWMPPALLFKLKAQVRGIVENESQIVIDGKVFKSDTPLKVGSAFLVSAGGYNLDLFYKDEVDAYLAEQALERQKVMDEELARQKSRREAFWEQYAIPFDFSVEIKEVLSGLGANSWGDGQRRNTVTHVFLHEEFKDGRLKRVPGQFLCTQVKSKWGGNWSGTLGEKSQDKRIVTCKSCLEIMNKFKKP